jgi:hypothetical protein
LSRAPATPTHSEDRPTPFKSKKQADLMFAAEKGNVPGVKPSAARKMVKDNAGKPIRNLPTKVKKAKKS